MVGRRLAIAVGAGLLALLAALVGMVLLVLLAPEDVDAAIAAVAVFDWPLLRAVVLAGALLVALVAATATDVRPAAFRGAVCAAVLAVAGAVAVAVLVTADRGFEAAAWRHAAAAGDVDAMERLARDAVEDGALAGRDRAGVRRLLGAPERVRRDGRLWQWDLGMIGDALGPGDAGSFFVVFGADGRVVDATVDQAAPPR